MNYRDGRLLAATLVLCVSAIGYTQDATSVLREVDTALGASSLTSLRYSGSGFAYAFLQNPRPDVRYPKFYAKYTRADGKVISGPSLADLVKKADPRMAEEMDARLARTRDALAAIRNPFDREIQPDNKDGQARVQAGIDALRAQALSIGRAANSMQIFLSDLQGVGD